MLRESEVIAKDNGMFVAPCEISPGHTHYVVYRRLPDGHLCRLGRRSTVESLRRWVELLASVH
jgi:hypothetical protein